MIKQYWTVNNDCLYTIYKIMHKNLESGLQRTGIKEYGGGLESLFPCIEMSMSLT